MVVWLGCHCSSADCRPGPGQRGATGRVYTAAEQRVAPIIRGAIAKDAFEAAEITAFETLTATDAGGALQTVEEFRSTGVSHTVSAACKRESEQLLVNQTG